MAHHYVCTRCGAKGFDFDLHTCKGMPDLSKMPLDLLRRLALKEIDEAQAWAEAERRANTKE